MQERRIQIDSAIVDSDSDRATRVSSRAAIGSPAIPPTNRRSYSILSRRGIQHSQADKTSRIVLDRCLGVRETYCETWRVHSASGPLFLLRICPILYEHLDASPE